MSEAERNISIKLNHTHAATLTDLSRQMFCTSSLKRAATLTFLQSTC